MQTHSMRRAWGMGAWGMGAGLLAGALLAPEAAHAAGGGVSTTTFQNILVLLGVIGVAYITTHVFLDRLQRRFGVVTGVEYIILGLLLGPILGLLDASMIAKFKPALVLGTGSLGLLTGLHLDFRRFEPVDVEAMRTALWVTLGTIGALIVVPLLGLYLWRGPQQLGLWLPGLMCAGTIAMVADPGPLQSLRAFLLASEGPTEAAVRACKMSSALAVVGFGVLFCLFNPNQLVVPVSLQDQAWVTTLQSSPTLMWLVIHVVIGLLMGALFGVFLRRDFEQEKLLTVVMGMVIFTSGLAYYLKLSPIFLNFILGVVLINTNRSGHQIGEMLQSIERPLYITLFFFAGASLVVGAPWWAYGMLAPYLLLRGTGRALGGLLAMRTATQEPRLPMGRVLLAPGGLSVAMLLDFKQIFGQTEQVTIIYTGMLLAIVISEVLSYARARSWLIDFTDVPPEKLRRVMLEQRIGGR